jgi:hypothetical protein
MQIDNMLEFYVVGISLGTAWAHPSSGDTVASVMIGGLRTVQNGAFPIHTNDLICIYFDDERDFFEVCFFALFCFTVMCKKIHVLTQCCAGQRRQEAQALAAECCG